jgi:hypothetical protein
VLPEEVCTFSESDHHFKKKQKNEWIVHNISTGEGLYQSIDALKCVSFWIWELYMIWPGGEMVTIHVMSWFSFA